MSRSRNGTIEDAWFYKAAEAEALSEHGTFSGDNAFLRAGRRGL